MRPANHSRCKLLCLTVSIHIMLFDSLASRDWQKPVGVVNKVIAREDRTRKQVKPTAIMTRFQHSALDVEAANDGCKPKPSSASTLLNVSSNFPHDSSWSYGNGSTECTGEVDTREMQSTHEGNTLQFDKGRSREDKVALLIVLVLALGAAASSAFIWFGLRGSKRDQQRRFENQANELTRSIEDSWKEYEVASLWVHEACRATADQVEKVAGRISMCTREDFSELYLYLRAGGLEFSSIAFFTIVLDAEREALEEESRSYYAEHYPDFEYPGIVGLDVPENPSTNESNISSEMFYSYYISPRPHNELYFVAHRVEPFEGNEWLVDFDAATISRPSHEVAASEAVAVLDWKPLLSERTIIPYHNSSDEGYSVYFFNPGAELPNHLKRTEWDSSGMAIYVPDVLRIATSRQLQPSMIFVYDNDDFRYDDPAFLAGALISPQKDSVDLQFQREVMWSSLSKRSGCKSEIISVVNRQWTVVVCRVDGTYEVDAMYVIFGGLAVFIACLCLVTWFYTTSRKAKQVSEVRTAAEREKAALIVQNANRAAEMEREMSEYMAHEIRNPLSVAISACSFVKSAISESDPLRDEQVRQSVREDVDAISSSLQFANDLLRSMIDLQKTLSNRIALEMAPTSILQDILEPVGAMLRERGSNFEVQYDCEPENLAIMTDRIRLKQIMFNLSGNAQKFVEKGYIRLGAAVVDKAVQLWVQDTGPGIPESKRKNLFEKYQESLDVLSQGTGMGLCLCQGLSRLLGGELSLDETFDSGIEGCPGARFVLTLRCDPIELEEDDIKDDQDQDSPLVAAIDGISTIAENKDWMDTSSATRTNESYNSEYEPPENLNVLVVDDDMILRRLVTRTLKRVAPTWSISQAANGERALELVDEQVFDLIFLDQYMVRYRNSKDIRK